MTGTEDGQRSEVENALRQAIADQKAHCSGFSLAQEIASPSTMTVADAALLEDVTRDRTIADTDSAKTPKGEDPPALATSTLEPVAVHPAGESEATPTSNYGYFGVVGGVHSGNNHSDGATAAYKPIETLSASSNISSPLHSAGASSSSLQSTGVSGLAASSADSRELFSRLIKVQSGASTFSVGSRAPGRQSSKPYSFNSPSSISAKSRQGLQYPDQSYAALHYQPFTPPYPQNRAHSPFLYGGSHKSDSPNRSEEYLATSPRSRTGGNTPVESPGLFSRRGRVMEEEMESSQYRVPSLHPTHNAAPKTSHFLRKDFDAISGHKLINEYEILRQLGKGTHGKVKLARPHTNAGQESQMVAIKIVKRFKQRSRLGGRETQEDKVKREIAVLKKARHPHVVSLIEVIDDPDADKVYMVLEYVEEGEMKWRRRADKWVADFERRRVEREHKAWERGEKIDPSIELAEIDDFNSHCEWRIHEKRRILLNQKQRAFEAISSRKSSSATIFTDDEQPREFAQSWSLEHGGESENEMPEMASRRRKSRMGLAAPFEELSFGSSPYALRNAARSADALPPFRDPFASTSDPASPALSTLGAPLIAPSLPTAIEKDKNFLRELKNIQRADNYDNFAEEDQHFRHVPCLALGRTRECFRDTILGLEYLHYQGIIHRDIKPANLLWTKDHRVKISDFGVSYLGRRMGLFDDDADSEMEQQGDDDVELAKTVGTPAFYAPELCDPDYFLEGKDSRRKIGPQMDIWALGITLYCMIFGRLPFAHNNQIRLFEIIAKQPLFVPSKRLRAISLNKRQEFDPKDRPEDVLQYDWIDDELRDLLRRLLDKDPLKRITIPEIKAHPWVVKGMPDPASWLEQTDPANYIKDKRIEVTEKDVKAAIAPLSFTERMRQLGQRMHSLVRGRDSSKRATSRTGHSVSASSRSTGPDTQSRRASLRSDDLFSAFRSSYKQESTTGEHPLSQSQLASPVQEEGETYFDQTSVPPSAGTSSGQQRPPQPDRGVSTAESVKTIRAARKTPSRTDLLRNNPWSYDGVSDVDMGYNMLEELAISQPPSLTQRLSSATRGALLGLASKRSSMSMSSHSTSSDRLSSVGDAHTAPLVSVSSATAAGKVEMPLEHKPVVPTQTRRPRAVTSPRPATSNTFDRSQLDMVRQEHGSWLHEQRNARPHSRSAALPLSQAGAGDEAYLTPQNLTALPVQAALTTVPSYGSARPSSSRRSVQALDNFSAVSSSDDVQAEAMFSDKSRHPSMPSVVSASSVTSASPSVEDQVQARAEKDGDMQVERDAIMSTGGTMTPAMAKNMIGIMKTAGSDDEILLQEGGEMKDIADEDDENGYNGDHDADEDSDDEGIVFGGKRT